MVLFKKIGYLKGLKHGTFLEDGLSERFITLCHSGRWFI